LSSEPAWPTVDEVREAPLPEPGELGIEEPGGNGGRPNERPSLPWRWSNEIIAAAPPEPEWIWEGYIARGMKSMLAGLPKGGKTTKAAALIEAITSGAESFLGRHVTGGTVVLISEEGDATLAPKLRRLPERRLRVLNRDAAWPKPSWAELISDATREAVEIGAVMLVIDSVAFWAALPPEREKDPGAAQSIMDALDEATRAGLAVLLVHHQRKAPGEHGTAVRGSGALTGAVDVVIEYERVGEDDPRQRRLVALSRWPQTPDVLIVDYDRHEGTWRVVGEAADRGDSERVVTRERLLGALPDEEPGPTEDELATLLGTDKRKISGPLRDLLGGEVERAGEGKKGDPYRYHQKAAPNAAPAWGRKEDSDAAPPVREAASNLSAPEIPPRPEGQHSAGGCVSHPGGVVEGCRYCRTASESEPPLFDAPDQSMGRP
jgi:hypothetical protein